MDFFDLSYFFFALLVFIMGFLVFLRDSKKKHALLFFTETTGLAAWMITLYLGFYYVDRSVWEPGLIWMRLAYGTSIWGMSAMTAFIYAFPRATVHVPKFLRQLFAAFTVGLIIVSSFTPLVNDYFLIVENEYIQDTLGSLFIVYVLFLVFNLLASLVLSIMKLRRAEGIEKEKIAFVSYGYFAFVTGAVLTNVVLPVFDIVILQREVPILIVLFIIPSYYAIHKYRFFNLHNASLNLIRKILLYAAFFSTLIATPIVADRFLEINLAIAWVLGALLALFVFRLLEREIPVVTSESQKKFRVSLTNLQSKIYTTNTFDKLSRLIQTTFAVNLNITEARLYVLRDKKQELGIPVYVKDNFTKALKKQKDVIVAEELPFQKFKGGTKKILTSKLKELEASIVMPLFADKNLIGFLALGSKASGKVYKNEEIEEIIKIKNNLEVILMNILLNMNLQEENDLMKSIVNEKTKVLQKKIAEIKALFDKQAEFIAASAHEFKTPLTVAILQMEELMSHKTETKDLSKKLKRLDTSLDNLKNLTQELFDVQQLDLNQTEVTPEKTDMGVYLKRIRTEFAPLMKQKNIQIRFHTPKKKVYGLIDKQRFRQVLVNLLGNAYKFTPEKGKAAIHLKEVKGKVQIEVCNSATIPEADKKHIFEKFKTKDAKKGMGLGLYISKKIVELHKGKIWLDEKAKDRTSFIIEIKKAP